jgi:hypothetical protein
MVFRAAVKPPLLAEFPSPSSTIALLLLLQALSHVRMTRSARRPTMRSSRNFRGANRVLSNEVGVYLVRASKGISRRNRDLDQFASRRSALHPTEIRLDEEHDSGAN